MSSPETESDHAEMGALMEKSAGTRYGSYLKKCGPGWLQGAITLGGGSLAGALYLGVIMGYHMMWLQPLAMILGVVMLSAIAYCTLSTGERPFRAINTHLSPALGWGWLIATIMANIVWCLPQFSLATAAIRQNLMPGTGLPALGITIPLFLIAAVVIWFYNSGTKGIKLFELILKIMVGIVVLSFFGVILALLFKGNLEIGRILSGLIPDFSLLSNPAPAFAEAISATGAQADYWRGVVVSSQKDKMIAAFATAVGINMTFLLPYSMLKKSWGKNHRELAIFDLATGLIVPFVIATGCVVIASASQFHASSNDVLNDDGSVNPAMTGSFNKVVDGRLGTDPAFADANDADKQAMRDSLAPA
ncbi:MAG: divalent metal cation transporter [Verrucomicrobiota bacterium]